MSSHSAAPPRHSRRSVHPRFAALLVLPLAAVLASAPGAAAHGTAAHSASSATANPAEGSAEHKREHGKIDGLIERIRTMPKAQRTKLRQRALGTRTASGKAIRLADQDVGPASEFGAWTTPPFKASTYALDMILLPTGRVLVISMGHGHGAGRWPNYTGQDVSNDGLAAIWDPAKGTGTDSFREIPAPPITLDDPNKGAGYDKERPAPIACTGHVQLADGRLLVAGGNLEGDKGGYGLKLLFLFDPYTEQWLRQQDLGVARWYPTLTRLPSGKVAIIGGHDEVGRSRPEIELYPDDGQQIPGIDTSRVTDGETAAIKSSRTLPSTYPRQFVTRTGKLAIVGPTAADQGVVDPDTGRWTNTTGFRQADLGYATFFPEPGTVDGPSTMFAAGGLATNGNLQPLVGSIRPELDAVWKTEPALKLARRNAPSVILPDGSVVIIGGGVKDLRSVDPMSTWPTRRQPELWDPVTHEWKLGPAQARPRGYHSTAVLLPDGRVLSGGDDLSSTLFDDDLTDAYDSTFELYSPPYLFRGARPVLKTVPPRMNYGLPVRFTVDGDASQIKRVTLVAPGSNTHAFDMNQRQLELPVLMTLGNSVYVQAPPRPAAAPPGDYMLFALNAEGVPSVAKFVQVLPAGAPGHPGEDQPPIWSAQPTPTSGPGLTPTPPPTAAPTPTPAPPKATRPWWWPAWLPWNG